MANEINFLVPLSPQLQDRLRVRATKERGFIISFVVQYEALIAGQWYPIVRYDTSHGFSHKDTLHPSGREDKQPLPFPTYNGRDQRRAGEPPQRFERVDDVCTARCPARPLQRLVRRLATLAALRSRVR